MKNPSEKKIKKLREKFEKKPGVSYYLSQINNTKDQILETQTRIGDLSSIKIESGFSRAERLEMLSLKGKLSLLKMDLFKFEKKYRNIVCNGTRVRRKTLKKAKLAEVLCKDTNDTALSLPSHPDIIAFEKEYFKNQTAKFDYLMNANENYKKGILKRLLITVPTTIVFFGIMLKPMIDNYLISKNVDNRPFNSQATETLFPNENIVWETNENGEQTINEHPLNLEELKNVYDFLKEKIVTDTISRESECNFDQIISIVERPLRESNQASYKSAIDFLVKEGNDFKLITYINLNKDLDIDLDNETRTISSFVMNLNKMAIQSVKSLQPEDQEFVELFEDESNQKVAVLSTYNFIESSGRQILARAVYNTDGICFLLKTDKDSMNAYDDDFLKIYKAYLNGEEATITTETLGTTENFDALQNALDKVYSSLQETQTLSEDDSLTK